jgi:adenylate cyclase
MPQDSLVTGAVSRMRVGLAGALDMGETRKLAAILVSDVVGYSRLAGADEDRILARLRTLRSDLIDPTIAVHHGRIVKRTGDGSIVEFRSVVDAVRCAVEVQNGMRERNAGVPDDQKIQFRVGIHLGDVVEESDGDLMGDGVNIAARLQSIAQPGAICLSEQAYWQVQQRLDLKVTDLGATQLKNIAQPVRVYSLEVGAPGQPKPAAQQPVASATKRGGLFLPWPAIAAVVLLALLAGGTYTWRSGLASRMTGAPVAEDKLKNAPHLSIVVLPFANLSGDPEQDYFADGITDDLTTDLSHMVDSFVIARNTALTYKGKPIDVKQIGKDLGVRYALEGSVQPTGNRVRVNAQLIDTETGAHLWAEDFDHDRGDLLATEDDIVTRLARTLQIQLTDIEAAKLQRSHPVDNPDVQELTLRCQGAYLNSRGDTSPNASDEAWRPPRRPPAVPGWPRPWRLTVTTRRRARRSRSISPRQTPGRKRSRRSRRTSTPTIRPISPRASGFTRVFGKRGCPKNDLAPPSRRDPRR